MCCEKHTFFCETLVGPNALARIFHRGGKISGGGISSGGPYILSGTIGQPFAGWSIGGEYELFGDIWSDESIAEF